MLTKICTLCNKEKPLNEFHIGKRYLLGVRPQCKTCTNINLKNHVKKEKKHLNYKKQETSENGIKRIKWNKIEI